MWDFGQVKCVENTKLSKSQKRKLKKLAVCGFSYYLCVVLCAHNIRNDSGVCICAGREGKGKTAVEKPGGIGVCVVHYGYHLTEFSLDFSCFVECLNL